MSLAIIRKGCSVSSFIPMTFYFFLILFFIPARLVEHDIVSGTSLEHTTFLALQMLVELYVATQGRIKWEVLGGRMESLLSAPPSVTPGWK